MVDGNLDSKNSRIEQYRKKIAVMPLQTPKQYRSRVGRISRHRYLMDNRPTPAQRKAEIETYHETVARVTAKLQQVLDDIDDNTPTFRERRVAYDTARGAYDSTTVLVATLRMKEMEE